MGHNEHIMTKHSHFSFDINLAVSFRNSKDRVYSDYGNLVVDKTEKWDLYKSLAIWIQIRKITIPRKCLVVDLY